MKVDNSHSRAKRQSQQLSFNMDCTDFTDEIICNKYTQASKITSKTYTLPTDNLSYHNYGVVINFGDPYMLSLFR